MKRYLTAVCMLLAALVIILGLQMNFRWSGIFTWGIVFVCLSFATYFTKYIPNTSKSDKKTPKKKTGA
ncbi:hypothetical protein [Lentibacillus saliphilus]|uniref:hypothetical protein n=1 Tax=Lentibacillus saliphilus TaxID=2737028 RepID=UPI001C2F6B93|nr:hypothetical protein [Lentibacillus saliphilus]